jgi:hypothetical protein
MTSSNVGAGAALPDVSCTLGPDGTRGSSGAAPREAGTVVQITASLFCSQSQGSPAVAFKRSDPLRSFACPVAVSAIHSSMPVGLVFVNARCLPSGENVTPPIRAPGGTAILFSAPSGMDFTLMPTTLPVRC